MKKKSVFLFIGLCLAIVAALVTWDILSHGALPTMGDSAKEKVRVINMVTGEFKAETEDGKEIEAYRWDPGTIFVEKGEKVKLSIYGVNGKSHPFYIEGTDIRGEVLQGKETVIPLQFDKEGTYRLVCETHPDIKHNGPMIAYIVVD